jgi:hypothetical protein
MTTVGDAVNYYQSLSKQRKIELWAIVGVFVASIISTIIIVSAFRRSYYDTSGVRVLEQRNEALAKDNMQLLDAIKDLSNNVVHIHERDSLLAAQVLRNSEMIPKLDSSLRSINIKYNEKTPVYSTYSNADIMRYFTEEAARLRSVSSNR